MINRKKIIIFLTILSFTAIGFIVFMVYQSKTKQKIQILPNTGAQYNGLTPGVSTQSDVTNSLGTPLNEKLENGNTILEYKSQNPNFNNEFTIQNGKLDLVKQIVAPSNNITISQLTLKYGDYENILYGPISNNGFNLYVYPDKGVAYIGNQLADIIVEIWYFPTTTLDNFKTLYAKGYSENYSPIGQ